MTTTHHVRRSERGFSLAEILTATAIFAVIFIAALMVYDRSNRVYKQGVEASDVQQGTRVAFDKLVAELRMVGFDYDRDGSPLSSLASPWRPNTPYSIGNLVQPDPPNGHTYMCIVAGTSAPVAFTEWETGDGSMTVEPAPSTVRWQEVGSVTYQQPDEQVEFAGPSALVIRANFDYDWETGTCDTTDLTAPCQNGRERSLESASFPVVTTDNDEIVGYALKPTSGTGPDTLTFYADLTRPRTVHPGTGDEELPITIDNVDLCSGGCNNPPYTLYRFTFDEDGNAIETPIADNIRSMNFRYFTDAAATAANEIATADLPDGEGPYNGAEPDADVPERALRADVRSIRIALVGMNPQLDPAYNDPSDAIAPKYRKYTLETLIVPRNIGRHGMREFASTAPSAPTLRTVCAGSCNAVYLVWTPPLTGGDVETYNILYSPMGATPVANACETAGYVYAEDAGRNLDGYAGIFITPGQVYKFAIQSVNKYGSATSGCVAIHVENSTRPLAPTDLDATNDVDPAYPAVANQVNLKWPRVNQNDPAKLTTTCSDATSRAQASMPSAERRHFVMWKSKDEMFTPGDAGSSVVVDSTTLPQPMTLDEFVTWADPATANCTPYFYRIQTIDYCNTNAAWNQGGDASVGASTGFYPPVGSAATRGRPFEDQTPPAAPPSFALVSDTCAGGFCDFVLRWSAVTRDDGAAPTDPDIYIENYDIRVEQKANVDPLDTTYTLVTSKTITDGGLEARFDDLAEPTLVQPYRFIVRARDCINGVDSTPVRYPCLFGNDPTATVDITAPVNYGGAGTSGNAWVINDPSVLRVVSSVQMSRVSAGFFQGGESVGSVSYEPGSPFTSYDLPIPMTAPDSIMTEVLIVVTDTTGCKVNFTRYVIDPAAPGCALTDKNETPQPSPRVEVWSDRTVTYAIYNESTVPLTVEKVIINWTRGTRSGDAESLDAVTFPNGTTTLATPCTTGKTVIGPVDGAGNPTTFTISAGPNTRQDIVVRFTGATGRAIQQNPINRICVVYRVPTGDQLSCSLITQGGTCDGSLTGTACQ